MPLQNLIINSLWEPCYVEEPPLIWICNVYHAIPVSIQPITPWKNEINKIYQIIDLSSLKAPWVSCVQHLVGESLSDMFGIVKPCCRLIQSSFNPPRITIHCNVLVWQHTCQQYIPVRYADKHTSLYIGHKPIKDRKHI